MLAAFFVRALFSDKTFIKCRWAGIDPPPYVPDQHRDVEITFRKRVLSISQPPLAELLYQRTKGPARFGKMPFMPRFAGRAALNNAGVLQLLQSGRQQCLRHQRDAAAKIIEAAAAG